jgi:thiamine-phosphate pyrophosphorylase
MCNPSQSAPRIPQGPLLLYYITDRKQFPGRPGEQEQQLIDKISECAMAGVDFIQLREKDLSTRRLEDLACKAVAALPSRSATKLLINSRIDVALACGAHGVHLPGNYLTANEGRAIFTAAGNVKAIVAVSTHSIAEVALAESHGADFAVFGPVFEKSGVPNRAGLQQLTAVCHRTQAATPRMPVLALGGVTLENAAQCVAAGVDGLAAIRLFQDGDANVVVSRLRGLRAAISPGSSSRG